MPGCPKVNDPTADCDCNPRQIFGTSAMDLTLQAMMDPRPPKRVKDPEALRSFRLLMQGEPCQDCEMRAGVHVHHNVFRSQGGGDTADNLVWLCRPCHDARHGIG